MLLWRSYTPVVGANNFTPLGRCRCSCHLRISAQSLESPFFRSIFELTEDSGKSLNPAVDIGQIEAQMRQDSTAMPNRFAPRSCQGSLIQALGFSLLEEESRAKDGRLINCGTWEPWNVNEMCGEMCGELC